MGNVSTERLAVVLWASLLLLTFLEAVIFSVVREAGAAGACAASTIEEVTADEWCEACFKASNIKVAVFRWVEA